MNRRHCFTYVARGVECAPSLFGGRVGADLKSEESRALYLIYVTLIGCGHHSPESIGLHTTAEMQTVGRCLGAIRVGELPNPDSMWVQRLKASDISRKDKNWNLVRNIEIVPRVDSGLITKVELVDAVRRLRLLEAVGAHARADRRSS
jgi:hypothetical protein